MKIGMLAFDYYPNIGGVASHVYNLAKALAAQGHDVTVFKPQPAKGRKTYPGIHRGVRQITVEYDSSGPRPQRVLNRWRATVASVLEAESEDRRFDIIHQQDTQSTLAAASLGAARSMVWTNHLSGFVSDVRFPLKRAGYRLAYRRVRHIICASRERRDLALAIWKKRTPVSFIPNGVDLSEFCPRKSTMRAELGWSRNDFVVLSPSRIAPVKGTIYLAQAVSLMAGQTLDREVRFAFAGTDTNQSNAAYAKNVWTTLGEHLQTSTVRLLGNIDAKDMPIVFAMADAVVLPSLQEAVSLAALEAMACGVPVIASRVGGLLDVIQDEHTGLLVDPGSPTEIAHAIQRLVNTPGLADYLAANAIACVRKRYSWDAVAQLTSKVYESTFTDVNGHP